jgi:hypothetical protein
MVLAPFTQVHGLGVKFEEVEADVLPPQDEKQSDASTINISQQDFMQSLARHLRGWCQL